MNASPKSLRLHIGIFGRRNTGKSSLLNAITRQRVSIVSSIAGTTTDPVEKPMEVLPIGPVLFIDTAGLDDVGALGQARVDTTRRVFDRADVALVVVAEEGWSEYEEEIVSQMIARKVPVIVVLNKSDVSEHDARLQEQLTARNIEHVVVSATTGAGLADLREALIKAAPEDFVNAPALLAHIAGVYEQSDWMEIDERARRLEPLLNDEYGRDCLTELLGPVSLPSQQANDYMMSMHSNRANRIYSPIPYAILKTGDYTNTSGPLFPGRSLFGPKAGKWRTSRGLLDQEAYNIAARAYTPTACSPANRYLDDYWLNYHHTDPAAQELYLHAQRQSRVLAGRGASLTRADIERAVAES